MFGIFRRLRRRRYLAEPFPPSWASFLERNMGHYALLDDKEKARLHDDLRVFRREKRWEGCQGVEMTDEIQVTIGALACLLVLGLDVDCYNHVVTVLVYPAGYKVPEREYLSGGLVAERHEENLGTAFQEGVVIVSWLHALDEARSPIDGSNLVLHEFAHQLDLLDGEFNGTPYLADRALRPRWQKVMQAEFDRLTRDEKRGRDTVLDPYGLENPEEFFAVATEAFFENPLSLRRHHPDLYAIFKEYYRQDPVERWARWEASRSAK